MKNMKNYFMGKRMVEEERSKWRKESEAKGSAK